MPIHDWTRTDAGTYHSFHQNWTIEIYRTLNRGILPPGYTAMADLKVGGAEPDVAALRFRGHPPTGGTSVVDTPPRSRQVTRAELTDDDVYARKANRIIIRHRRGQLVAAIEVVSPGNKNSKHGIGSFVCKMVDFLRNGINVVVIDPFPPGPRDPEGVHRLIWDEFVGTPAEPRPAGLPLTVVSYDAGEFTAYLNPVAVGEPLPDAPLFLAPGWYVNIPLERTYMASWVETPPDIRDEVAPQQPPTS